jgi:hypothetical protein
METRQQAYQRALETNGVPANLAKQTAEIIDRDEVSQPNLGRTEQEQHLVRSAHAWMFAKPEE